jgi:bifunctional non-homologous end joining protein LigD
MEKFLTKGLHQNQPAVIRPMLATLIKEPFVDENYLFEVKWDGYRIIAFSCNEKIKLQSRGGEDYTRKYPSIVKALSALRQDCIIDGEVVFIDQSGKPDFDALQRVNGQNAPIVYYVFDLLWLDGKDLTRNTLVDRKALLKELVGDDQTIRYSDHFSDGKALYAQVKDMGLEGIVAKRMDSPYVENERSKRWLKVTIERRQEFVIGGWVESEKRNTFRTLLFGSYENGKLKWKGHAGGGFKDKDLPIILNRLKELEIDENPFDSEVEYSEGKPHWVKPELVANIKFATLTRAGKIRKPAIFLGFRQDKHPRHVETEAVKTHLGSSGLKSGKIQSRTNNHSKEKIPMRAQPESNWIELEKEAIMNREVVKVEDCSLSFHNVERELWKGITKADLIQYYLGISKYILPHIENRPLSLYVKPNGPYAAGLYIKDMEGRQPECATVFRTARKHKKKGKRDVIEYLVCDNTATLLYLVNLGCIDINPWTSTVDDPISPNFIVIDLDPTDEDFKKVIATAQAAKDFFDRHKLKAFVKTSGKTGMHLFLPCSGFDFRQARKIAERISEDLHQLVPEITTTTLTVADRKDKLYIDPNQNDYSDTVAAAYSVRPFRSPLVSAPLEWKEVVSGLTPDKFTMQTILKRLERKGELFYQALNKRIAYKNSKSLRKFME